MSKKASLADQLARAAQGIVLPSEFDGHFSVVQWPNAEIPKTPSAFRQLAEIPPQSPVESFDASALISRLGGELSTDGADVKRMRAKFRKLAEFLRGNLNDLRGFRVGNINVELYILGASSDGEVLGLKALGVET